MVIKMEMDFDTRVYNQVEKNIRRLPKEFQSEFFADTRRPINNLRKRIKRAPSRFPTHPFIWSHNAQKQGKARRWWFAAIAGRIPGVTIQTSGGRYRRSGKLLKNTNVIFDRKGRRIIVEYPDVGKWVIGEQQVPSHARTPWKRVDKEAAKAEVEMSDVALKSWDKLTDRVIP